MADAEKICRDVWEGDAEKNRWLTVRRVQGASLENESQMVARSLGVASVGPEKHILARGRG